MLKQETIDKIANILKIKPADLATAIKDEKEVEVTIDEKITTFTEDEIATVKKNGYKEGKTAGEEMAVDEVKKEMGLSYDGKSVKALAKEIEKKTLADAKIEPEKKVLELQEKITNLQKTVGEQETKLAEKDGEVSAVKIHGELVKHIPATATLSQDKIIGLMKMDGYEFKSVDGKVVAFKDGKELQDKISNAMLVKDVISGYVTENKLAPVEEPGKGGRGGKDEKGAGVFTKLSEIKAKYEADKKSTLGADFAKEVAEAAKVPEFDMNA